MFLCPSFPFIRSFHPLSSVSANGSVCVWLGSFLYLLPWRREKQILFIRFSMYRHCVSLVLALRVYLFIFSAFAFTCLVSAIRLNAIGFCLSRQNRTKKNYKRILVEEFFFHVFPRGYRCCVVSFVTDLYLNHLFFWRVPLECISPAIFIIKYCSATVPNWKHAILHFAESKRLHTREY